MKLLDKELLVYLENIGFWNGNDYIMFNQEGMKFYDALLMFGYEYNINLEIKSIYLFDEIMNENLYYYAIKIESLPTIVLRVRDENED